MTIPLFVIWFIACFLTWHLAILCIEKPRHGDYSFDFLSVFLYLIITALVLIAFLIGIIVLLVF